MCAGTAEAPGSRPLSGGAPSNLPATSQQPPSQTPPAQPPPPAPACPIWRTLPAAIKYRRADTLLASCLCLSLSLPLSFSSSPSSSHTMSSSSTTACSRSPSPATPATPDSDARPDVVTQEDLAAWCHSLSPAGFLIGEESHFAPDALRKNINRPVKLEDIVRDEPVSESVASSIAASVPPVRANVSANSSPAPAPSDASSKYMLSRSPSVSLPMGIEVADLLASARNSITSTKPIPPPLSHIRRDAAAGSQCVVYPPKESCYKYASRICCIIHHIDCSNSVCPS